MKYACSNVYIRPFLTQLLVQEFAMYYYLMQMAQMLLDCS